jgi:hypothetical protein
MFHGGAIHPAGQSTPRCAVIDTSANGVLVRGSFTNILDLQPLLDVSSCTSDARLFVIEDLSVDFIELFGSRLHIDPAFFSSHVYALGWYSRCPSPTTIPPSRSNVKTRLFLQFRYIEARSVTGIIPGTHADRLPCVDSNTLRKISILPLSSTLGCIGFARRQTAVWTCSFDNKQFGNIWQDAAC